MNALYPHILLPTDGSALATRGAKAGVKLAQALAAKVTVLFVSMPYASAIYGEGEVYFAGASPAEHKR